jgi:hypothetical protein
MERCCTKRNISATARAEAREVNSRGGEPAFPSMLLSGVLLELIQAGHHLKKKA